MSLLGHLEELRLRLIRVLLFLAAAGIPCYFLAQPLIEWLQRLGCPSAAALYYMKPMALFFLRLKVGLVVATVLAAPFIAYQTWRFVLPALRLREQRLVRRLAWVSGLLFMAGAAVALRLVFPLLMRFAYGMESYGVRPLMQVESVVNIALALAVGFGLVFQLPIVLFFGVIFGLVSVATLRRQRPYMVVGIFFVGALLTPPDVLSQLCMAMPAWLLYEVSLLLLERVRTQRGEGASG